MASKTRETTASPTARAPAVLTVGRFMTPDPHTIGPDETLAAAHRVMRKLRVRHLPVVDRGKLVGLVSQRDPYLLETLAQADPNNISIVEAMTPEPYCVGPDTPVAEVARTLVARRHGSAVVVEDGRVIGIFTTSDALRALIAVLDQCGGAPA
jgi:acetoin utilization protein AcuB